MNKGPTTEPPDGPVTTVTFEEMDVKPLVVVHELHPSKQAVDDAIESGSSSAAPEQFELLDEILATLVSF